ncbi:MAG: hypothetical protein QW607_09730 [Desulfurococcaceae archaeon]
MADYNQIEREIVQTAIKLEQFRTIDVVKRVSFLKELLDNGFRVSECGAIIQYVLIKNGIRYKRFNTPVGYVFTVIKNE